MPAGNGKVDTYGCPEFFVDCSEIEIMGGNVRLSFGIKRGEQVQGVFSLVMPIEAAMLCSRKCNQIAEAAFNDGAIIEKRMAH